jgi:membrane-bound metal-dependent hydrolase YbcI (DUF457 family)
MKWLVPEDQVIEHRQVLSNPAGKPQAGRRIRNLTHMVHAPVSVLWPTARRPRSTLRGGSAILKGRRLRRWLASFHPMFIGHIAVGFAAKRIAPGASLAPLMAATLLLDLAWPIFVLAGWERVRIDPGNTAFTPLAFEYYPYTHSLLFAILWSAGFAGLYFAFTRYGRGAHAVAAVVFSHWLLDAVVHRPDLPLYPGSDTYVGLGLWNSVAGTIALELALFASGFYLYFTATRPMNKAGSLVLLAFTGTLLVLYFGNVYGPPPPSPTAVASAGLALWLIPVWAAWFDRNRAHVPPDRNL